MQQLKHNFRISKYLAMALIILSFIISASLFAGALTGMCNTGVVSLNEAGIASVGGGAANTTNRTPDHIWVWETSDDLIYAVNAATGIADITTMNCSTVGTIGSGDGFLLNYSGGAIRGGMLLSSSNNMSYYLDSSCTNLYNITFPNVMGLTYRGYWSNSSDLRYIYMTSKNSAISAILVYDTLTRTYIKNISVAVSPGSMGNNLFGVDNYRFWMDDGGSSTQLYELAWDGTILGNYTTNYSSSIVKIFYVNSSGYLYTWRDTGDDMIINYRDNVTPESIDLKMNWSAWDANSTIQFNVSGTDTGCGIDKYTVQINNHSSHVPVNITSYSSRNTTAAEYYLLNLSTSAECNRFPYFTLYVTDQTGNTAIDWVFWRMFVPFVYPLSPAISNISSYTCTWTHPAKISVNYYLGGTANVSALMPVNKTTNQSLCAYKINGCSWINSSYESGLCYVRGYNCKINPNIATTIEWAKEYAQGPPVNIPEALAATGITTLIIVTAVLARRRYTS